MEKESNIAKSVHSYATSGTHHSEDHVDYASIIDQLRQTKQEKQKSNDTSSAVKRLVPRLNNHDVTIDIVDIYNEFESIMKHLDEYKILDYDKYRFVTDGLVCNYKTCQKLKRRIQNNINSLPCSSNTVNTDILDDIHISLYHGNTQKIDLKQLRSKNRFETEVPETERFNYSFGIRYSYWDTCKYNYVTQRYKNLKTEIFGVNKHNIDETHFLNVFQRAKVIQLSDKARKTESKVCKFDINKGAVLTIEHIMAVFIYCRYDEICYKFTKTFRKLNKSEPIESLKKRNSYFWWLSRLLREVVRCYGISFGDTTINNYYHGVSKRLIFDLFIPTLKSPTSTTISIDVANNFAGPNGMVIEFKQFAPNTTHFNCTWISPYSFEGERLFFGDGFIEIFNIRLKNPHQNLRIYIKALRNFQLALSDKDGNPVDVDHCDKDIINTLIKMKLRRVNSKYPQYINVEFIGFCQRRKEIRIKIDDIYKHYKSFSNILFRNDIINLPDIETLAALFCNCPSMVIDCGSIEYSKIDYKYMEQLLSMLKNVEITTEYKSDITSIIVNNADTSEIIQYIAQIDSDFKQIGWKISHLSSNSLIIDIDQDNERKLNVDNMENEKKNDDMLIVQNDYFDEKQVNESKDTTFIKERNDCCVVGSTQNGVHIQAVDIVISNDFVIDIEQNNGVQASTIAVSNNIHNIGINQDGGQAADIVISDDNIIAQDEKQNDFVIDIEPNNDNINHDGVEAATIAVSNDNINNDRKVSNNNEEQHNISNSPVISIFCNVIKRCMLSVLIFIFIIILIHAVNIMCTEPIDIYILVVGKTLSGKHTLKCNWFNEPNCEFTATNVTDGLSITSTTTIYKHLFKKDYTYGIPQEFVMHLIIPPGLSNNNPDYMLTDDIILDEAIKIAKENNIPQFDAIIITESLTDDSIQLNQILKSIMPKYGTTILNSSIVISTQYDLSREIREINQYNQRTKSIQNLTDHYGLRYTNYESFKSHDYKNQFKSFMDILFSKDIKPFRIAIVDEIKYESMKKPIIVNCNITVKTFRTEQNKELDCDPQWGVVGEEDLGNANIYGYQCINKSIVTTKYITYNYTQVEQITVQLQSDEQSFITAIQKEIEMRDYILNNQTL